MTLRIITLSCGILLLGIVTLSLLYHHHKPLPYLQLHALAIGQGDGMVLTTPYGKTVLIDGGPDNSILMELPKALGPYKRTIDLLIISHGDADHIGGLLEVLPRYHIKGVLMTSEPADTQMYRRLRLLLAHHEIPIITPHPTLRIHLDPTVYIDVLFPWEELLVENNLNRNDTSVVVQIHYGETSLLLTGDIEEKSEQLLLRTGQSLQSTLLKLGHHGSKSSTTPSLVAAVHPKYSLLQYGSHNKYGHPHQEAVQHLAHTTFFDSSRNTITIRCTSGAYCQATFPHTHK